MAQPERTEVNGVATPANGEMEQTVLPGKRKREAGDEGDAMEGVEDFKPEAQETDEWASRNQKDLISTFFDVLKRYVPSRGSPRTTLWDSKSCLRRNVIVDSPNCSYDGKHSILFRPIPATASDDEPQPKRQKSVEPAGSSISEKVSSDAYVHIQEMLDDLKAVSKAYLTDLARKDSQGDEAESVQQQMAQIRDFRDKAVDLFNRERAYPGLPASTDANDDVDANLGEVVLSVQGFAPAEKRLFSSLPLAKGTDVSEYGLPNGLIFTRIMPSMPVEKSQTLGEVFSSPRQLPTLQAPKQPKTQTKGNMLDVYYPELTDKSKYRANSYFSQKLTAGHYLDYTNATPADRSKTRHRERAQSLAGKVPSSSELEVTEMESLFRGAFSSFAPCKDDSASIISSNTAGRMWWQRAGQRSFRRMVEVEYYAGGNEAKSQDASDAVEIDEAAIQESIDTWDDSIVDPTLEDIMGTRSIEEEKEADEILEEVSDLIETLASYQRIRNLNLPNSQNRQSSDPVNGDMLANAGPHPTEEEQATYQVLKAQLALIIKTLPPYAVAKLNGDQLDELLISTKMQIQTDQYVGTMEEDNLGVQARMRAQQAAQTNARPPPQRTPSASGMAYAKPYQPPTQYGTPTRTPSQGQPYYRQGSFSGSYQQPTGMPPTPQPRPPHHPNQYQQRPPNGYPNQYATQLAKTQTPYGHQNMSQFAGQQRMPYGGPQQATPNQRYNYSQSYSQPGTPGQANYTNYTNGVGGPPRTASPQMNRQNFSPSPNLAQQQQQQAQRFSTPNQSMQSGMSRFSAGTSQPPQQHQQQPPPQQGVAGPTGYHSVIPEAQQQRILEQAKARVAAQERTAQFGDKISSAGGNGPSTPGVTPGSMDVNRLAAARASLANLHKPQSPAPGSAPHSANGAALERSASPHVPPRRVTPVPLPSLPGQQ